MRCLLFCAILLLTLPFASHHVAQQRRTEALPSNCTVALADAPELRNFHLGVGQNKPCRPRRHAKLPAITELTYHRARKKLVAAGWQPVRTKSYNEADSDPDISYGNGQTFWKRGYVEVESCSGTGVAACAFLFEDAYGNRLRVTTAGEELPKEKVYARVSGFRFVCE